MVTMPIAGALADRHGAGRVVRPGVALVIAGTVPFVSVDAPTWLLSAALFLRGVGMGATLIPAMAAAYTVLKPDAVARASSALALTVAALVPRASAALVRPSTDAAGPLFRRARTTADRRMIPRWATGSS